MKYGIEDWMSVWEKNPVVLSEYEWNVELGMKGGWIWCIEYVNNENEWVFEWLDAITIHYKRRMKWLKDEMR